jgi:hypothetical protein
MALGMVSIFEFNHFLYGFGDAQTIDFLSLSYCHGLSSDDLGRGAGILFPFLLFVLPRPYPSVKLLPFLCKAFP